MNELDFEHIIENIKEDVDTPLVEGDIRNTISFICRCEKNRAPVRYLLSGLIAKINDNTIDLHKPYVSMGTHSYPGRTLDEGIVQHIIHKYHLPCNSTTAFLTPAFRTVEEPLTKEWFNTCRPAEVYHKMMDVIEYVESRPDQATPVLSEIIRILLLQQIENGNRLMQLQAVINDGEGDATLSCEEIVNILNLHLKCQRSSRLPVLMISAMYETLSEITNENHKPLLSHNAADSQTGSLGDIEIIIGEDDRVVTCYEVKKRAVTFDDVDVCLKKLSEGGIKVDNYLIVTTEEIDKELEKYVLPIYREIGIEVAILDCIGFVRHLLHFFTRYRMKFIDNYQQLVLDEPDSSVSQPLKEAFLSIRRVAESEE
jgi:hypothetical protein